MNKLTQELKNKWIEALKSGKYTQGASTLRRNEAFPYEVTNKDGEKEIKYKYAIVHCPIGVLGEICSFLSNSVNYSNSIQKAVNGVQDKRCPYYFLSKNIGIDKVKELFNINDSNTSRKLEDRTYDKSIKFIKELNVK